MAMSVSRDVAGPLSEVFTALVSRQAAQALADKAGASLIEHVVEGDPRGTGSVNVRTVISLPAERVPAPARPFLKNGATITVNELWKPLVDGKRTGDLKAEVGGAPVKVTASEEIGASPESASGNEGTTISLYGNVNAPIPFIGAKIATMVEEQFGRMLSARAQIVESML